MYNCTTCGREFKSTSGLNYHTRKHHTISGKTEKFNLNNQAPASIVGTLIACFDDPSKAVGVLNNVIDMYSGEAERIRFELHQVEHKILKATELRDTLSRVEVPVDPQHLTR